MEQQITRLAVEQGLWAVLFVGLLFYVLRDSKQREDCLKNLLKDLADKYKIIHGMADTLDRIEEKIR